MGRVLLVGAVVVLFGCLASTSAGSGQPPLPTRAGGYFLTLPRVPAHSCLGLGPRRTPRRLGQPVPRAVARRFAVLSRAAQSRDRLPRYATKYGLAVDGLHAVFAPSVRRLGEIADGNAFYVVPATPAPRLRPACMKRLAKAGRARRRALASRLRRTLLICLDDFGNGGGDYCFGAAEAIAGRAVATADGPEPPGQPDDLNVPVSVAVLVPDGAASIRAHYPGEPAFEASVKDNFATFDHTVHIEPKTKAFPNLNPQTIEFLAPDGSLMLSSHPRPDAPTFGDP